PFHEPKIIVAPLNAARTAQRAVPTNHGWGRAPGDARGQRIGAAIVVLCAHAVQAGTYRRELAEEPAGHRGVCATDPVSAGATAWAGLVHRSLVPELRVCAVRAGGLVAKGRFGAWSAGGSAFRQTMPDGAGRRDRESAVRSWTGPGPCAGSRFAG